MLINYKKPKAGFLNVTYKEKDSSEELPAERRAHINPKFATIVPGISDVPDVKWNRIKDDPTVVAYRKKGWIVLPHAEVVKSKTEGVKDKELSSVLYKDLKGADQEALIKDCDIIAQLKKWKKHTKESAAALLNDRIDRLEHPEKYADDED